MDVVHVESGAGVHGAYLRGDALDALVVGGAPDDVSTAEARAPDADARRIGVRLTLHERDRGVDVLDVVVQLAQVLSRQEGDAPLSGQDDGRAVGLGLVESLVKLTQDFRG